MTTLESTKQPAYADPSIKKLIVFGTPVLASSIATAASSTITMALLGRQDTVLLAVVSAGIAIMDVAENMLLGATLAYQILSPRFAMTPGSGRLRQLLYRTAILCTVTLIICCIALTIAMPWLVSAYFPDDARNQALLQEFIFIRMVALVPLVAFTILGAHLLAHDRAKSLLYTGLTFAGLHVGTTYLLVTGPGIVPPMGVAGASWAYAISLVGAVLVRLALDRSPKPGSSRVATKPTEQHLERWQVTRLSWPGVVSGGADYLAAAVFFAIVGFYAHTSGLAVARVAFEIEGLLFTIAFAYTVGVRVFGGQGIGDGAPQVLHLWWRKAILLSLTGGFLLALLATIFRSQIALFFTNDADVRRDLSTSIMILAISIPFIFYACSNSAMLKALGRTAIEMVINISAVWGMQIGVTLLLIYVSDVSPLYAALWANTGYWIVRALTMQIVLASTKIQKV